MPEDSKFIAFLDRYPPLMFIARVLVFPVIVGWFLAAAADLGIERARAAVRKTRPYYWLTRTFDLRPPAPGGLCKAANTKRVPGVRCENYAADGKDCGQAHRAGSFYWT